MFFSFFRLSEQAHFNTTIAALFVVCVLPISYTQAEPTNIIIKGSTTILPIAKSMADEFEERCEDVRVQVGGGGSAEGITSLILGKADIATSSTFITKKELELARQHNIYPVPFRIADDCIIPVVHKSNSLRNISREDLKDIYLGLIDNWKQLGGPDLMIEVISRDKASGTYEVWHNIIMDQEPVVTDIAFKHSNAEVVKAVSRNQGAIGYIGLGYLSAYVKPLRVDGVIGSEQSLRDGTYLINRPLFMFTNGWPRGKTLEFINFVLDQEGGQIHIEDAGYIPLN